MAQEIVVVGIGMITPVGGDVVQTFTSIRAGLSAFNELSWLDKAYEPFVMAAVPDEALPELEGEITKETGLTSRESRMLKLAGTAIQEAVASIAPKGPVPLFLGFPENETTIKIDHPAFLKRLTKQAKLEIDFSKSELIPKGRAAGLLALQKGIELLAKGKDKLVIIGGVDSYKDLYILGTLDMEARVKTSQNLDGFIPGEGAGFLVLTTAQHALATDLKPLCKVSGVATGFEEGHLYSEEVYKGEGLAEAVGKIFENGSSPKEPIQTVFAGFNGESHWAKEWGVAFLRNRSRFAENHAIEHPADCFGDTGAASGPLMIGLVTKGVEKNFRRPPFFVFSSSDKGDRAAAVLEKV